MKGLVVAACLGLSGCVSNYESIHSDFHTIQNGEKCYTVANDERKFNAPTMAAPPQECDCEDLKPVKRLVVKAGESPEVMSCPAKAKTIYHVNYAASLASVYVPAIGQAAIGAGIGLGLAYQNVGRMTQSVTGGTVYASTLNGTAIPGLKFYPQ